MLRIIHNVTILTNDAANTILTDQAVAVEGSYIAELGHLEKLREAYPDFAMLDGGGRLLMPGLVNTHMHFYSTFARGLALPGTPRDFADILSMLWWKLDSALDEEAIYYSALIPAITAVKRGVTSVIDHHASARAVDGSLDRIEAALATVGLRAVLCYEISDRDGKEIARKGLRENERYILRCKQQKAGDPAHLMDAMVGLHASFTLDNDTLEQAAALSRTLQRGCHVHLAEDPVDNTLTRSTYRQDPVRRLHDFGVLNPRSIAAHCIHLSEAEKDVLAESAAIVAHTPQSNMNNAVGRTDVFGYLRRGMMVGLGSDGMSGDMRPDIRTAALLHKHDLRDAGAGWKELQQIVLKNNPEIFRRVSDQKVGRIAPGYLADLILVDYHAPTPLNPETLWGHFLFGIVDADVHTTIINGRMVMQAGEVAGVDNRQIASAARRVAEGVWRRFRE